MTKLSVFYTYFHQRYWLSVWSIILLAWSSILCFFPLLNLLSFEFAFACCLPLSFLGAHGALRSSPKHKQTPVRIDLLESEEGVWEQWISAFKSVFGVGLIPLVPICLNALRVRNCNWTSGFLFYITLPLFTLFIASGYGLLIKLYLKRSEQSLETLSRTRFKTGYALFTALFVIHLLWGGIAFFATPSVDIFSLFMGYYPGAIYDEELIIGQRLLISRVEDLAILSLGLSLFSKRNRAVKQAIVVSFIAISIAWSFDIHRPSFWVKKRLGGFQESKHFQLYHPQSWNDKKVKKLLTELEFNYQELKVFFDFDVSRKILVYFYLHPHQKKRLMGANQTLIAKPWQRSIHIHAPYVGDRVITHELAHVFSADIAPFPHHLSMRYGVLPHMSLIEGLAVAATWTRGRGQSLMSRLTPHEWTAAMRKLEFAPPIERLLNPSSFYGYNSSLAYTMCGSFVRFFRDQHGNSELNKLYYSGGSSDKIAESITAWQTWLDQINISEDILNTAQALLNYPSIFYKVCAHELAARRTQASRLEAENKYQEALDIWLTIKNDAPGNQLSLLKRIKLLVLLGQLNQATSLIQKALGTESLLPTTNDENESSTTKTKLMEQNNGVSLTHLTKLKLQEWQIDLVLSKDPHIERVEIQKAYQELSIQSLNRPTWRRLAIKSYIYQENIPIEVRQFIAEEFFSFQTKYDPLDIAQKLNELIKKHSSLAELYYLLARQKLAQEEFNEAKNLLQKGIDLGLSHHSLIYESLHLLATLSFKQEDYGDAKKRFENLLGKVKELKILGGEMDELKLWRRRSIFFGQLKDN